MKKLTAFLIACLITVVSFCQTDSTLTDSTALVSIRDLSAVSKYLEDKLIAKDYNLVIGTLQSILSEAIKKRRAEKPKK